MNFNPLHEPGQGNQGLRACNGYRYEFHIGKGASLKDQVVYRVEFTNTLDAGSGAEPDRSARRRQRAALAAHRRHRDHDGDPHRAARPRRRRAMTTSDVDVLGSDLPVLPNNHGPQTDRLVYGSARSRATTRAMPTSREVGLYDQAFVDTLHPSRSANGGRVIAGQFDDPYQLDEKGIFDLVNLAATTSAAFPARAGRRRGRVHRLQRLLDRARGADRPTSSRTAFRTTARSMPNSTDSLLRVLVEHQPPADADRRRRATSSPASRARATGCRSAAMRCRCSTPAWSARSARRSTCAAAR